MYVVLVGAVRNVCLQLRQIIYDTEDYGVVVMFQTLYRRDARFLAVIFIML
jgi:hypothetical protein